MTEEKEVMGIDALDVAIGVSGLLIGLIVGTLMSGWLA